MFLYEKIAPDVALAHVIILADSLEFIYATLMPRFFLTFQQLALFKISFLMIILANESQTPKLRFIKNPLKAQDCTTRMITFLMRLWLLCR